MILFVSLLCTVLLTSARNVNLEVPAYFLEVKQGYTVRKMEKIKGQ
jgi:hypothetical protein